MSKKKGTGQHKPASTTKRQLPRKASRVIIEWLGRNWQLFVTPLGLIAALVGLYSFVVENCAKLQPPDVQIALFEKDSNGRLRIIPTNSVQLDLSPEDVFSNRVSIPLNLAVRNLDRHRLDIVRIEVRYPNDLKVESSAKAKIDPENHVLIYEHDVGILESIDAFTPLQTIDIIHIPFQFVVTPVFALTKDGVPTYILTVVASGDNRFSGKVVRFAVQVFSKDRPPLSGIITYHLEPDVQIVDYYSKQPTAVPASQQDRELFESILTSELQIVDQWSKFDSDLGVTVGYRKGRFQGATYQYITVDGQARRMIVDANSDGNIEYELFDTTRDGVVDFKFEFPSFAFMYDWSPHSVR